MSAEGHVLEKSDSSKSLVKYILVLAVFLGALWLSFQNDGPSKFPKQITDEFTFTAWVNDGEDYLKKNYRWMTKIIAGYIKEGYFGFMAQQKSALNIAMKNNNFQLTKLLLENNARTDLFDNSKF